MLLPLTSLRCQVQTSLVLGWHMLKGTNCKRLAGGLGLNRDCHVLLKSIVDTGLHAVLLVLLLQQDQVPVLGYSLETAHSSASTTCPTLCARCTCLYTQKPYCTTPGHDTRLGSSTAIHAAAAARTCPPLPMQSACPIASSVLLCASSRVCRWGLVPWPSPLAGWHLPALLGTQHRHSTGTGTWV